MTVSSPLHPPHPFRWNLARRRQLGSLLEGPAAPVYGGFLDDLLCTAARVIGLCDNGDLYFVGRSLESMFDLLSGLLLDSSWCERLELIHFSSRFYDLARIRAEYPSAIPAFRPYLGSLGLAPETLASRGRHLAFVDIVSSGSTLGNLIKQIAAWAQESEVTWNAVAPRVRIVGITGQEKTSPKTWRWQQHADWIRLLETGAVKNVSVPRRFYGFVADVQVKVATAYPPWRWGDEEVSLPSRDTASLEALRLAVRIFDWGTEKETRAQFARLLAEQPAMRHRWFRSLALDLKTRSR